MPMLVLEVTYGVFRRGSSRRSALANAPVGFFLGAGGSTGANGGGGASPSALSVYSASADALSVLSGRLSYTLGLTGPCLTTDTACSSSLVAAHLAASGLRLAESPEVAVTGVGMLAVVVTIVFSTVGMLSALGRCHTFDGRADGYCRGEGCGAFYFSTSGDVAVSGTAVQQDGPSASLTAPNGSSQRRLIEAVRIDATAAAAGVPSLEAHGTGTALGDPIEARRRRKGRTWHRETLSTESGRRRLARPGGWAAAVRVAQVEPGPPRGGRRGRGPGVAGRGASAGGRRRRQRAAAPVDSRVLKSEARETRCIARRLNAHLASIASSGSFRMPGEVLPRCGDATAAARLSSFGFSGTIAHALFASGARSSTASGVSLYTF